MSETQTPTPTPTSGVDQVGLETLWLVFNAAPIGIAISGDDLRFRMVNQKLADMLGYSRDELIGKNWRDLTHPEDQEASAKLVEKLQSGDQAPAVIQKRYLHKSGRVIWASLTARTIASSPDHDRERLTLALIEDINAQRRSEELARSLSEQTSLLATIIQKSPLAVILTNESGEITYVNRAAQELLGISETIGALGQSVELFDAPSEPSADDLLRSLHTDGRWSGERYFRQLGSEETIPVHVTAFRFEKSGMGSLAFVAKDISQRKQVEAELRDREARLRSLNRELFRAQEKERSRIARDLHDDVTQRLAMVAVELGFLQSAPERNAEAPVDKLQSIREQILELTDAVRDLSHKYHPSVLSHSKLEGALEALCQEFESHHGIKTRVVNHVDTSRVSRSTATAIYRIIQEALQNVARHAEAGCVTLTLGSDDNGDELRVSVVDDGKGFDAGLDGASLPRGLGLTSMEERAAAIRGSVKLYSEPGEGTRVEIATPIVEGCEGEDED